MKLKQKILVTGVFTLFVSLFSLAGLVYPAYADPAATGKSVVCNDGKTVVAHKYDAPPVESMDDKDYQVACKKHRGYTHIDETIVCKDGSSQNVYKKLADPKDKLDDKDRQKACKGHGGIKPASSDDEPAVNDCGGVDTAIIKCDSSGTGLESNAVWKLLIIAINILSAGVGILAVGGIIYASILYTTAEDKQDQINKAKDIIQNVVIGLVAYALMWAGLNFLIPGGLFS
ncbi:hypothetical protein RAAC3_TM7C00001G0325 [Candidatus Saccharibacteria bacterium RAAC3_TM7_1]|nr:hypothetical protein RAAC3_TM7C00001G0325 [Candidatus Saccharibacteria bacterium RAAC3_TM7_1]HCZ28284.1 hypothetical protein [Candidatus Saccharibacteria bacterium]